MSNDFFKRIEQKYLVSKEKYDILIENISDNVKLNKHGFSTISNLYYDTNNYDLAIASIQKPIYKEKIRLRSYGVPSLDDKVFLEIKKKYDGIVGKRRIEINLNDVYNYIENKELKLELDDQTIAEIDYTISKYTKLEPKICVFYERVAYQDRENKELRITFDCNLRYRIYDVRLEEGDYGELFFNESMYIMEIKTLDSLPIWLVKELSKLEIYNSSFSKYGNIYMKLKKEMKI